MNGQKMQYTVSYQLAPWGVEILLGEWQWVRSHGPKQKQIFQHGAHVSK